MEAVNTEYKGNNRIHSYIVNRSKNNNGKMDSKKYKSQRDKK